MPKPEDDKKAKKAIKKQGGAKKDEKPFKGYRWEDKPPMHIKNTIHFIQEAKIKLMENVFPADIRADQCNPGVAPCIIKEVYLPPQAPEEVATLIESAVVY